jgi:hypothetical protein
MVSRHLTGVERSSPRTVVMDASKCMGWKNLQCRTRYRVRPTDEYAICDPDWYDWNGG